ncbi:uncharacterized protein LOC130443111 [Diorhabda sublineata]|uniref:uncharacterized protein LOC130443111 n=1 Tax=Diorhabda sublineata TaxID=1163346 RepID=UPI0024E04DE6|nr:uncharacterized protein LOC130443111 [Diorhabda sublineata]
MAQIVKSSRGKTLLILENFALFNDKVLKSGELYWRYVKKNVKCSANVFTVGPEFTISRKNLNHNYEADEKKLNRTIISNSCKRKAEDDISEKPSKIIRRELSSNLPQTMTTTDVEYVRRNIYNYRCKLLPGPLPKNITEVHSAVEKLNHKTGKGECFLYINSPEHNIIVFSCDSNIRVMCDMNIFYMDGTFSYSAKYFLQMFTIHGFKNGHYVPLAYCLLPSKSTDTYINLFSLLRSKMFNQFNVIFKPSEVYVDFEKAIHNALYFTWPNIKINGCRFHLHQAWFRKIQALCLISEFNNRDSEIGRWIKHTFGITYLNPDELEDCFVFDLMCYKPVNATLDKYADYLLDVYIDKDSQFPPTMWSDGSPSIFQTTNACESFHSRFNSSPYSSHPAIYVFIEKLKEFQIDTYIKIQSLYVPARIKDAKVKNKLNFLVDIVHRFRSNQITRLDFVKCVSYYS